MAVTTLSAIVLGLALFQQPKPVLEDLKVGTGKEAAKGDVVSFDFRATILNGQILDSTFGQAPMAIKLGWRQRFESYVRLPFAQLDASIAGMKEGGKRRIVLPPELAYGDLEVGEFPAGNSVTIEVDLLEVHKKGVVPDLRFEEGKVGTGAAAIDGKTVTIHYRGTFLNGTQFDASRRPDPNLEDDLGAPLEFVVGGPGIIKGFSDGVKGMKVGGTRKVYVPYNRAYGEQGRQGIPPFSTLVFELELMAVK